MKVGDCVRRKDGITHNGIIDRYRWDGLYWIVVHQDGHTVDKLWEEGSPDFRSRIGSGKPGELVKCPDAPLSWPVVGEQAVNPKALEALYRSVQQVLTDIKNGRASVASATLDKLLSALDSAHIPQDPPND